MHKKLHKVAAILLIALIVSPAFADHDRDRRGRGSDASAAEEGRETGISARQAARMVQKRYGGRVLAVDTVVRNDRLEYRVKILTRSGVVRVVSVPGGGRR